MNKSTINVNLNRLFQSTKRPTKRLKKVEVEEQKAVFFGFLFSVIVFLLFSFFQTTFLSLLNARSPKGKTICDNV